MKDVCEYQECDNQADYFDGMDSKVCCDCMSREIEYGADSEEFKPINDSAELS